ncbi:leucine-rich repeat receptor-like protein kinase PXL2 [Prunus yedoensis var. nudiflora]|uniref:Leucine-rich repeat receptor-like protein kinase PXL2 n=1 Tax=Prunus yedoensis var. nudiflora TaxID=2094558 RepID=A0A314ZNP7_PRUYE|nr:leucine-rich repeat receptor-like protein kinase PXL2 [Prunus yedoensis var. nudiflora]
MIPSNTILKIGRSWQSQSLRELLIMISLNYLFKTSDGRLNDFWGNSMSDGKEVQNVAFVKVVGEHADVKAKEVFHRTRTAIDDVVLRPWTCLFSQQKDFFELPHDTELRKGICSLCYDPFEHNLKDWTKLAKPKPKGIAYNDKLKLPIKTRDGRLNDFWRNSMSELISGVGRIHSKGDGKEVQNVAFVKVIGEHADVKAKEVFHRTRTTIDDVVLRSWTYLFSQQKDFFELPHDTELRKGICSLCYDP